MSTYPIRKPGAEKPSTEKPITERSIQLPRLHAASTPSGTASAIVSTRVHTESASVGSTRSRISSLTCFLKKNDSPKSPRTTRPTQIANCSTSGRSRPSRARMAATSCEVALSPAMMAAGSPAVRRSSEKTTTATTAMTGIVARRRRPMYGSIPYGRVSSLLGDVPEDRHRGLDDAVDALARRRRQVPLAERDVGRILRLPHLHRLRDGLLPGRIGLARELIAQALDLLVARPAEHGLVAGGVHEAHHDGIEDVGGDPGGEERVPAAGGRRLLFRAPGDQRLPVHRDHVHLEAALLEERLGHRPEVGEHGEVGGVHQHDRRAVVARFLQQRPGLFEVRLQQPLEALGARQRRAAREERLADLVVGRIADDRLEEVLLVEGVEDGLADLGVVEGLVQRVAAERELVAEWVDVDELDVAT